MQGREGPGRWPGPFCIRCRDRALTPVRRFAATSTADEPAEGSGIAPVPDQLDSWRPASGRSGGDGLPLTGGFFSTPVNVGGVIRAGGIDGRLYAIQRWAPGRSFRARVQIESPAHDPGFDLNPKGDRHGHQARLARLNHDRERGELLERPQRECHPGHRGEVHRRIPGNRSPAP